MQEALAPIRYAVALAAALLALAFVSTVFANPAGGPLSPTVAAAIERATRDELGEVRAVHLAAVSTTVPDQAGLSATPEPGARTGSPARFVLWRNGTRIGYAVATVTVEAPHVKAARVLERDDAIERADVTTVDEAIGGVAFKRLPALEDVVGAHPRRTIAAGERLTAAVIALPPAVRSGDEVNVTLRAGVVEVTTRAVASGSGQVGDVIRVKNAGTRRLLTARITARGAVEVLQ